MYITLRFHNLTVLCVIYIRGSSLLDPFRLRKNMISRQERFLGKLKVVAVQNSLDGLNNLLDLKDDGKTAMYKSIIKTV